MQRMLFQSLSIFVVFTTLHSGFVFAADQRTRIEDSDAIIERTAASECAKAAVFWYEKGATTYATEGNPANDYFEVCKQAYVEKVKSGPRNFNFSPAELSPSTLAWEDAQINFPPEDKAEEYGQIIPGSMYGMSQVEIDEYLYDFTMSHYLMSGLRTKAFAIIKDRLDFQLSDAERSCWSEAYYKELGVAGAVISIDAVREAQMKLAACTALDVIAKVNKGTSQATDAANTAGDCRVRVEQEAPNEITSQYNLLAMQAAMAVCEGTHPSGLNAMKERVVVKITSGGVSVGQDPGLGNGEGTRAE